MKKVLIISYSDLSTDPRLIRQIEFLKDSYEVHTAAVAPSKFSLPFYKLGSKNTLSVEFYFNFPFLIRKVFSFFTLLFLFALKLIKKKSFLIRYWMNDGPISLLKDLRKISFDMIIANDIEALPLAIRIGKGKSKIVFDAHEYHPEELENDPLWVKESKPYITYLCIKHIPSVNLMITVCEGIADRYLTEFRKKCIVITNACKFYNLKPQTLIGTEIKLIHHGICSRIREIEVMLQLMDFLDKNYTLDLMLVPATGESDYYNEIVAMASVRSNVRVIPPIPIDQIPVYTSKYDIGLFLLPPGNFNYLYALPNKLFEFIQARLAIAIGPSPEMAKYVNKYKLGVVSSDFLPESLAHQIKQMTPDDIIRYKDNSDKSALLLSEVENKKIILSAIASLF